MDEALAKVRAEAVGQELDEELAARFPVKESYDIRVDNGGETVAHVYEPLDRTEVTPLVVNMHGGGFVKGCRGRDVVFSRNLAYNSGCLSAFMTPMSTSATPYIMGLGGYDIPSMFKQGIGFALVACVVSVFWAITVFPVI